MERRDGSSLGHRRVADSSIGVRHLDDSERDRHWERDYHDESAEIPNVAVEVFGCNACRKLRLVRRDIRRFNLHNYSNTNT